MAEKNIYPLSISLIISVVLMLGLGMVMPACQPTISTVDFADLRLEAAVREVLDVREGPLLKQHLLTITELDASGMGIRRLEGIEALGNLKVLNLHDNHVEDLAPLAELHLLHNLNLRNNEIIHLDVVNFDQITHLPLVALSLRHNVLDIEDGSRIRLSDIQLVGELAHLEVLDLRDNHIADVTPLTSLENLRVLDLSENRLTNVEDLHRLTTLEQLNLRENEIEDLAPLGGMMNLVYLNIHTNPIDTGWEVLSRFTGLDTLIMRNVSIGKNADVLADLTELTRINMRNTSIEDIQFLHQASQLAILDLRENKVEDISPLMKLQALETLDLRDNQITHVDPLKYLINLRHLNLRNNSIQDLTPLGGLVNLIYLNIHSNPVEEGFMALAELDRLDTLIMRNVEIGDQYLFLESLTQLRGLNIRNTAISSLSPLAKLMSMGALQDDIESGIYATVNILDNSPKMNGSDPYHFIRPYWLNITYRYPQELP